MHFEEGDSFWIPIYGLHHDPKHFPQPEKFKPERFSEEDQNQMNPDAFVPFGIGPRVCPAQRFVFMTTKAFLYELILNFEVITVGKTNIPLKLSNDFTSVAKDVTVGLKRRIVE